jgi:putative FmdB family regulatory protein
MPIYEFRCLACGELFEILMMRSDPEAEAGCPKCRSNGFERVISSTNFSVAGSGEGGSTGGSRSRSCSGGSCTTYDIPGCTR